MASELTYRHKHSCLYRVLNTIGRIFCNNSFVKKLGFGNLDSKSLIAAAEKLTKSKLDDKPLYEGKDLEADPFDAAVVKYQEPLKALLDDVQEAQKEITCVGRVLMRRWYIRVISNRIRIIDYIRAHYAALREERIVKPIFVCGIPRTGTTLTLNLLAADPNNRSLQLWQGLNPTLGATEARREVAALLKVYKYIMPHIQAVHALGAEEPEEDMVILDYSFLCFTNLLHLDLPKYYNYMFGDTNVDGAYRLHKYIIQLLQHKYPDGPKTKRWTLKAPVHLAYLDTLLKIYPDACIVWCHRDLKECLPSTASLIQHFRCIHKFSVDNREIGRRTLDFATRWLDKAMQVRKAHPENFFDQQYRDLVKDPIGCIKKIYTRFDIPWDAKAEEQMGKHMKENPQGKHGAHRYTLEQFGTSKEEIDKSFVEYNKEFYPAVAK